jgi:protein O-mannosyl-transferase
MKRGQPDNVTRKSTMCLAVATLLAVTIVAYWQVAHNEFINYDDPLYIVVNPHVNTGLSWDNVKWAFAHDYEDNWHPLTWISHMLDVQLFGLNPAGHHLVNLALHLTNTLLLLWFLLRTTARFWASFFVAGLFALHPLHVESVAWASERKDTLSTFFWLATMLAYAAYAKRPGAWKYLLVALLLALGLMAKQMLVTLPLVLLLLDHWPLKRFRIDRWRLIPNTGETMKRIFAEKAPLLALSAGAAILTMEAQHPYPGSIAPFIVRLLNAIISYGRYLAKMVWPTDLSVHYFFFHTPTIWVASPVLLFLLVVTITAWRIGRDHRYVLVGWLWYLGTLVPVIGLVQVGIQSHADRYTYVPLIGIFIAIAFALDAIAQARPSMRKAFAVGGAAMLLAMAAMTWKTVGYWKDEITLFHRAIEIQPENAFIRTALGKCFFRRHRYDEAKAELLASDAIRPYGETLDLLGKIAWNQNQYDAALDYFKQAIAFDYWVPEAHTDAGALLYDLKRYSEAEQFLQDAVICDPDSALAHRLRAVLLARNQDYAGAAGEYRKSLALQQDFAAWNNLGDAQENLQNLAGAEESYRKALAMDSSIAIAHYNLASVLGKLGRKNEAIAEANKAIALDPNDAPAKTLFQQLNGDQPQPSPP